MTIGPWQLLIVLAIVIVIFGPKNLPRLARIIGGWFREFKDMKDTLPSKDDFDDDAASRKGDDTSRVEKNDTDQSKKDDSR